MNLEDTIYHGCRTYPSIFPHRAAVLNHLFFVIGNGYEWLNGQLVLDDFFQHGKPVSLAIAIKITLEKRVGLDKDAKKTDQRIEAMLKKALGDKYKEICCKRKIVLAPLKQRCKYQEPKPGVHGGYDNWYPIAEGYSFCFDYNPQAIQKDWLCGIIEACNLVLVNPPKVEHNQPQERVDETITLAKKAKQKALKVLRKRFGAKR